jgi:Flp pilus assembly protein TadD
MSQSAAAAPQLQTHLRQANEFIKINRPDLAIGEFRAIVKLDPANLDARANLGTLLYFQGDYAAAVAELRAAVSGRPELWKTRSLLGMCEKRLGDLGAARLDLEQSFPQLQEKKLRIQVGMELVEVYYAAAELDKAATVIGTLRQLEPADTEILYTAQRIYSDQADEAMVSVAMLAPESGRMHQLMGHQMMRQANTEGAIAQYREALKIDPGLPGLHFDLAEALSLSTSPSDREHAEAEYEASLAQSPSDEKAECRLGRIAFARSDLKGAAAHYSRALALRSDDPEANLGLGRTLASAGQIEKAQPLLERAVQLDPSDPVAHFRLGTLYRQQGRADDARRELEEFQRLKDTKERLKAIYQKMRLQTREAQTDSDVPQ